MEAGGVTFNSHQRQLSTSRGALLCGALSSKHNPNPNAEPMAEPEANWIKMLGPASNE